MTLRRMTQWTPLRPPCARPQKGQTCVLPHHPERDRVGAGVQRDVIVAVDLSLPGANQLATTVAAVKVESRGGVTELAAIPSTKGDDWVPYCFHGAGMARFVIQPHVPGKPNLAPLPMFLRNVQRATA